MKTANLFLAALLTAATPLAAFGEAETPITLDNGILKVELGQNGLEKIHDTTTGKTVEFVSDSFSVLERFARVFLVSSENQTVDNKSVFSDHSVCSSYRPG